MSSTSDGTTARERVISTEQDYALARLRGTARYLMKAGSTSLANDAMVALDLIDSLCERVEAADKVSDHYVQECHRLERERNEMAQEYLKTAANSAFCDCTPCKARRYLDETASKQSLGAPDTEQGGGDVG